MSTASVSVRPVRATALCLLLSLTVCACYQYFPVDAVAPLPEPRTDVRIRLTTPVSLEAGSQTLHHVSSVEGDVYKCSGDTLAVFSRWLRTSYGFRQPMDGAVFYFDRSQFARLEKRRFVPIKTAIAVAAVGTGILLVWDWAIGLGGGGESSGPSGNGNGGLNIRVPFPISILINR